MLIQVIYPFHCSFMCSIPIGTFERFRLVSDGRGLLCYRCGNFQRRDETEQRHPDHNPPEARAHWRDSFKSSTEMVKHRDPSGDIIPADTQFRKQIDTARETTSHSPTGVSISSPSEWRAKHEHPEITLPIKARTPSIRVPSRDSRSTFRYPGCRFRPLRG